MRSIKLGPFSPITALTTAFNAQTFTSTGAAVAPTTTATTDKLAHLVTFVAPVQSTLAGITFTIIGTDANDNPLTESGITGPASGATVTSTTHFKTISTIQPSATMSALVVSVGIAAESVTPTWPVDGRSIGQSAITVQVTGTINFTMSETYGNPFSYGGETLPWVAITALTSKTATTSGADTVGSQALRVMTNSVTNTATFTVWYNSPAQITG